MDKRLHFPGGMESHFGFTEFCSVQLFCELNNSQLSCELEFMRELLYPDFLFIRGQITPSPYAKGAALFWIRPAPCAHKVMSIQTGGSSPRFQPGPFLLSNFEMLQIESETSMCMVCHRATFLPWLPKPFFCIKDAVLFRICSNEEIRNWIISS